MKIDKELCRATTGLALVVLFHALVLTATANAAQRFPGATKALQSVTKNVDPCIFGTEAQLKSLLSAGLGGYFPLKHSKSGEHVTISKPRLTDLKCPNLRVNLAADIRYRYRDHLAQTREGLSSYLSPDQAAAWHASDKGTVRFDPLRPQDSVWVGKP